MQRKCSEPSFAKESSQRQNIAHWQAIRSPDIRNPMRAIQSDLLRSVRITRPHCQAGRELVML